MTWKRKFEELEQIFYYAKKVFAVNAKDGKTELWEINPETKEMRKETLDQEHFNVHTYSKWRSDATVECVIINNKCYWTDTL